MDQPALPGGDWNWFLDRCSHQKGTSSLQEYSHVQAILKFHRPRGLDLQSPQQTPSSKTNVIKLLFLKHNFLSLGSFQIAGLYSHVLDPANWRATRLKKPEQTKNSFDQIGTKFVFFSSFWG